MPDSFRTDGKTGCGKHRGTSTGNFNRSEIYEQNPRSTVGTVTEIYDYFRLLLPGGNAALPELRP